MPYGPYPVLVRNHGWMKAYRNDTHYQACYLARDVLNLDVQMYRMTYDEDGTYGQRSQQLLKCFLDPVRQLFS